MLRLSLLLFALLAAGCYDDAGVPAPKNDPLPEANLSLPDLSAAGIRPCVSSRTS